RVAYCVLKKRYAIRTTHTLSCRGGCGRGQAGVLEGEPPATGRTVVAALKAQAADSGAALNDGDAVGNVGRHSKVAITGPALWLEAGEKVIGAAVPAYLNLNAG